MVAASGRILVAINRTRRRVHHGDLRMRRLVVGLTGVLLIVGGVLLLTPYVTKAQVPSGRSLDGARIRCKAPLADLLTPSDQGGSHKYDPCSPNRYPRASGELCTPESTW